VIQELLLHLGGQWDQYWMFPEAQWALEVLEVLEALELQ